MEREKEKVKRKSLSDENKISITRPPHGLLLPLLTCHTVVFEKKMSNRVGLQYKIQFIKPIPFEFSCHSVLAALGVERRQ